MAQCSRCGKMVAEDALPDVSKFTDKTLCEECFTELKIRFVKAYAEHIKTEERRASGTGAGLSWQARGIGALVGVLIWGTAGFLIGNVIDADYIPLSIGIVIGVVIGLRGGLPRVGAVLLNTVSYALVGGILGGVGSGILWLIVALLTGGSGGFGGIPGALGLGGLVGMVGGIVFATLEPVMGKTLAKMVVALFFAAITLDGKGMLQAVGNAIKELVLE